MAHINIVHSTEYIYRNPVGLLRHCLMLRPDDCHDLQLHHSMLRVNPEPALINWAHDAFNNSICFLDWPETLRTKRLSIVSTLDLTHHPTGRLSQIYRLEPGAELFPFSYAAQEFPDLASLTERQTPDPDRAVDTWARRFVADQGNIPTLTVLEAITSTIRAEFECGSPSRRGHADRPRNARSLLRHLSRFCGADDGSPAETGIGCPFVTGYLYNDTSGTIRGGGSAHAWCSVYVPGAGWVEYDPTNGLVAGSNLVRVGVARSAAQAIPISGGFIGDRNDPIGLNVDVAVSAIPI